MSADSFPHTLSNTCVYEACIAEIATWVLMTHAQGLCKPLSRCLLFVGPWATPKTWLILILSTGWLVVSLMFDSEQGLASVVKFGLLCKLKPECALVHRQHLMIHAKSVCRHAATPHATGLYCVR